MKLFKLLILILTFSLNAQPQINSLPSGVSIHQLDNGIEVILIEKPGLPMVGVNTVVKVGSAYESFATSGMSHMLEHLLFNGTKTMKQKELYNATDRIGGYNNANTGEYFTNYMMVTPAENIKKGMQLQTGMLFESVLPKEKFEKEKGIVLEEIAKTLASPNEQLDRNALSIIYKGHALSLPTLGTYETIKNMNRDEVYTFYKNYYVPNNMIVSVIGNFETESMLKNLKEIYGKYKPGSVTTPSNSSLVTGFSKIPKSENSKNAYHRFYNGDALQMQLYFELDVPANKELFELLELSLQNQIESVKSKLNKKYNNVISELTTSTKIFPVKNYLEVSLKLNNDLNLNDISNEIILLLSKTKFELSKEVVETESVKTRTRFLKNTEKPHMFGIYNASLFAEEGIEAILESYNGAGYRLATDELLALELSNNPIIIIQHPKVKLKEKSTLDKNAAILFPGNKKTADLIVKQNKQSNLLAVHYLIKHKSSYESKFGKGAAKIWHKIFGKRMKLPELQKEIAQFGFTFTVNDNPFIPMDNIYLDPAFGYIRVEGLADDVESAIKFLNHQMLNFIPTKEEFEKSNTSGMASGMMGGRGKSAKKLFNSKLDEILYKKNKEVTNEQELTYESLLQFGKSYFTPSNMIVSVVSYVSQKKVAKMFSTFVEVAPMGMVSIPVIKKEFNKIVEEEKIEMDGEGEQSHLYYGFQKSVEEADVAALQVLSLLLSEKIIFNIREKQGLAYRMKAGIERLNDKAMFFINVPTMPKNVDKLVPQFSSFFNPDFANGITENELTKTVNMYLGRMMFRRLSSINQAYYLGSSKFFHNDILYDSKFLDDLKKVTVNEVKAVAKKYLKVESPVQIIVR
ncbi:MAG: insulinase family protein [Melioribacteraceae bacterium]